MSLRMELLQRTGVRFVPNFRTCCPSYGRQRDLEFVQSSKNIIDADFDDENEMNKTVPVPTSSEMSKIFCDCGSLEARSHPRGLSVMSSIPGTTKEHRVEGLIRIKSVELKVLPLAW
ncbi:hypothetical protein TNCV_2830191 [Trichonephila clavipes]|nr:hypothetical protein TNCV_2830191 [Trichonephila clavipes]